MNAIPDTLQVIDDELDVLANLIPLDKRHIIELGCGAAQLARSLLGRYPASRVTGLEVDERQHARNLASPQRELAAVRAAFHPHLGACRASFARTLHVRLLRRT